MSTSDFLREPFAAALFAAAVVTGYVMCRAKLNNQKPPANSEIVKPAVMVGVLVYFIVSNGIAARETISTEPFI